MFWCRKALFVVVLLLDPRGYIPFLRFDMARETNEKVGFR